MSSGPRPCRMAELLADERRLVQRLFAVRPNVFLQCAGIRFAGINGLVFDCHVAGRHVILALCRNPYESGAAGACFNTADNAAMSFVSAGARRATLPRADLA